MLRRLTNRRWHERSVLQGPVHKEPVVYLVQFTAAAGDHGCLSRDLQQRGLDLGGRVGLRAGRGDAGGAQGAVGVQRLEQIDDDLEVVRRLQPLRVARVAVRVERADAGPVGRPLVLPEVLGALAVALPVVLHIRDERRFAIVLENGRYAGIGPGRVTVLVVGPVAVIGPQAVDRPGVAGPGDGVRVPELRLQKLAAGLVDAARADGGRAGARGAALHRARARGARGERERISDRESRKGHRDGYYRCHVDCHCIYYP